MKHLPFVLALALSPLPRLAFAQGPSVHAAPTLLEVTILAPAGRESSSADRAITQRIRDLVVADGRLSSRARSVRIDTVNAGVTLQGSVASAEEKEALVAVAEAIDGVKQVDNRLVIVPDP